ncbi:MAG: hydrogenase expression/formation protein HypE [Lachnospiraceae bacterium]|nr:hydrogenase expression/formation protein HypE [Lachnospiraceae bacterium]
MKITMAHGSGGEETEKLISRIFAAHFQNEILDEMEDAAAVPGAERLALTTDSFVVEPLVFPGGDIGKLGVCGTVNDLLMRGAVPKYLTCGFILEAGTDAAVVEQAAASMAQAAAEAGVLIVAGDTKVVENAHEAGGIVINTAGVGFLHRDVQITPSGIRPGDCLILSGSLGDHHAAILSARMRIENHIRSDVGLLTEPVSILLGEKLAVHAMRDVTRGGLATILSEFAKRSGLTMRIRESALPVHPEVRDFCGILGLDPLTMGNEGKFVAAVDAADAETALKLIRDTACGREAVIIGEVTERAEVPVILETKIGGERVVTPLTGEGLPRIC